MDAHLKPSRDAIKQMTIISEHSMNTPPVYLDYNATTPLNFAEWGADAMTLSAHKDRGPKGVAALIVQGLSAAVLLGNYVIHRPAILRPLVAVVIKTHFAA